VCCVLWLGAERLSVERTAQHALLPAQPTIHQPSTPTHAHPPRSRYAFNIVFNILNKSALNAFPCPWFISAWQLSEWGGWLVQH
jgi:hypothetical protein